MVKNYVKYRPKKIDKLFWAFKFTQKNMRNAYTVLKDIADLIPSDAEEKYKTLKSEIETYILHVWFLTSPEKKCSSHFWNISQQLFMNANISTEEVQQHAWLKKMTEIYSDPSYKIDQGIHQPSHRDTYMVVKDMMDLIPDDSEERFLRLKQRCNSRILGSWAHAAPEKRMYSMEFWDILESYLKDAQITQDECNTYIWLNNMMTIYNDPEYKLNQRDAFLMSV